MAKLRIYTDENVDVRVVEGLRHRGVEAMSAYGEGKRGITDEAQFSHASSLRAAIFTHDPHFIEIALEKNQSDEKHYGVIFVGRSARTGISRGPLWELKGYSAKSIPATGIKAEFVPMRRELKGKTGQGARTSPQFVHVRSLMSERKALVALVTASLGSLNRTVVS